MVYYGFVFVFAKGGQSEAPQSISCLQAGPKISNKISSLFASCKWPKKRLQIAWKTWQKWTLWIQIRPRSAIEYKKPTELKMDELPELPFRKVLSYLSLEEVIKLRAVSRSCQWMIDNYRVMHLCYSRVPIGHIIEKNLWVTGAFTQNLIVSTKFESFFKTFSQSILSHLKHLRLYDIDFNAGNRTAFTRMLNSLGQLEELDLVGKWILRTNNKQRQLKLKLPMLKSVLFEQVLGIKKLTLEAPNLKKVKINWSSLGIRNYLKKIVSCRKFHFEISSGEDSFLQKFPWENFRILQKVWFLKLRITAKPRGLSWPN